MQYIATSDFSSTSSRGGRRLRAMQAVRLCGSQSALVLALNMPLPLLVWPVSADPVMSRDHNFRPPAPLTAIETARRAAALMANQGSNQPIAPVVAAEMLDVVAAADADTVVPEGNDAHLYGQYAARILSDCQRDVALASVDAKMIAFKKGATKIGQAVADQWLPMAVMADRLLEIAEAHGSFGLNPEQLQYLISDAVAEVAIPQTPPASVPLKRRLITHRASDLQPEKMDWVWPGRIPEGKLVLLGGPPGLGKSQLTAFMAATISKGGDWPCNEGSTTVGSVIFMSAEDGIEDTIIPRLMAAGANLDRVQYRGFSHQAGWHRPQDVQPEDRRRFARDQGKRNRRRPAYRRRSYLRVHGRQ
jgi:hypothetical protein